MGKWNKLLSIVFFASSSAQSIIKLADFICKIISCILLLMYCFVSIVVGNCSKVFNAESINRYFCFFVKLFLKHSRKIFGYRGIISFSSMKLIQLLGKHGSVGGW